MKAYPFLAGILLFSCSFLWGESSPNSLAATPIDKESVHAFQLPLGFEQNLGQADAHAKFIGRSAYGTVFLTDDGAVLTSGSQKQTKSIYLHMKGARRVSPTGEEATGGMVNYYQTWDRGKWLTQIPVYSRVRYHQLYEGVDAVFHGNQGALEFDFEIAPGSSAENITIAADGAEHLSVASDGSLEILAGQQTWRFLAPEAYQLKAGARQNVKVSYVALSNKKFKLVVGRYDRSAKLIIDPVVQYSRIIAVSNDMEVDGTGLDSAGNLYIAGTTFAADYPVVNGQSGKFPAGSEQVYLTKLNPTGDTILFSTYIPCSGFSTLSGLVVDGAGNSYVVGSPGGSDYPVTNTALGTTGGFLTKFNTDGTMGYSTILGGTFLRGLAVDAGGDAFVTGGADANLPTINAFETAPPCPTCGANFFAKVNPTGDAYLIASYFYDPLSLPTTSGLNASIAVDQTGNIFLLGRSPGPHVNAWQIGGGLSLAKVSADGHTLLFSSDLGGGSFSEKPVGMRVGSDGTVFIVGTTQANDYPYSIVAAGHPLIDDGSIRSFATAINPTLNGVTYSTYLSDGAVTGMFLDANNHLYVSGAATRILPLENAVVSDVNPSAPGFLMELDATGQPVEVSRFGSHLTEEIPTAITADGAGNIFIAGSLSPGNETPQPDPVLVGQPISSPPVSTALTGGNFGVFFAKIGPVAAPQISLNNARPPFLFLRNAGSADLHISSMTFSAGKIWGNCGTVVAAGSSCVVTVSDLSGSVAAGTLTIASDAQPAVQSFTVHPVPGQPTTIGDFLWFDDDRTTLPLLQQQTIPLHIWNVGTANAVINQITISPGASQTNNCGAGLPPGGSCTVQVATSSGAATVSVIFDNGAQRTFSFFAPQVFNPLLSVSTISFPTQFAGGVQLPRTVTVTNTGAGGIGVSALLTGDPEFTIAGNTCPPSLPSGQSCVIGVSFTPVIDGNRSGVLTINGEAVRLFAQGAIQSAIQVAPLEQDFFPTVIHLGSETFPVTLTNTLTSAIPITGIAFSAGDYSETDDCAGQVSAGGSCTVQVKFVPQAVGARNGTMTVNFTGATTQVLTLTGEGQTPFSVNPLSLSFTAPVGGTSAEQGLGIGNRLFVPEGYTFTLTGPFAIAQNPCPQPMPPNGTTGCGPTIVFQPKTPGQQQGTFTISYAGITEQDVVTLSGTASAVSASPLQLNFPVTKIPGSSTLDVTLSNSGASPVNITSISTSAPYSEADTCQRVVPGNGSCVLHVSFTPQTLSVINGGLNISLADGAQYAVSLSGSGTGPVITLATFGTTFQDQVVGTTRNESPAVNIINNGDTALNITGISMTGDFSETNNCPGALISTCSISVQFTPTATGVRTGTLTITDDGSGSPQTIVFTGTGTDFAVNATGAGASASVTAGQTATYTLAFSAVGSFAGQIQVGCSGAPQLATCTLSSPNVNVIGSVPVPLAVTVTTSPHTSAALNLEQRYLAGFNLVTGLLMIPLIVVARKARKSAGIKAAMGVVCLLVVLTLASCGGGGGGQQPGPPVLTQGGTPAGTYTLTVTATDQTINGPVVHQTNLTLVVH